MTGSTGTVIPIKIEKNLLNFCSYQITDLIDMAFHLQGFLYYIFIVRCINSLVCTDVRLYNVFERW